VQDGLISAGGFFVSGADVIQLYALRMRANQVQIWYQGILTVDAPWAGRPCLRIDGLGSWTTPISNVRTSYLGECQFFDDWLPDLIFEQVMTEMLVRWEIPIP